MAVSIVTKYSGICAFCGKPAEAEHHLVFGSAMRALSDKDGLTVPVCNKCHNLREKSGMANDTMIIHNNSMAEIMSKMIGQLAFEKQFYKNVCDAIRGDDADPAREAFMKRYGRSYL